MDRQIELAAAKPKRRKSALAPSRLTHLHLFETMDAKEGLASAGYRLVKAPLAKVDRMTIHFAAARNNNRVPHIYLRRQPVMARPANDNGGNDHGDGMLHGALRHFARHGIGAAREAREQAKQAFFAGDRQSYDWWVSICRMLDKRIAMQLECETAAQGHIG